MTTKPYDKQLEDIKTGDTPVVGPDIDSLSTKYLGKLQRLVQEVMLQWKEYHQAHGDRFFNSMHYFIYGDVPTHTPTVMIGIHDTLLSCRSVLPKEASTFYELLTSSDSVRVESPSDVLDTLERNHTADIMEGKLANTSSSNRVFCKADKPYFCSGVRDPVLDALVNIVGLNAETAQPERRNDIYGVGIESSLFICGSDGHEKEGSIRLTIVPHIGSLDNYFKRHFDDDGTIFKAYNSALIIDRALELDKYEVLVECPVPRVPETIPIPKRVNPTEFMRQRSADAIRKVVKYDISEGGQVAPLGLLALRHLAAARDLLRKKTEQSQSSAASLDARLSS